MAQDAVRRTRRHRKVVAENRRARFDYEILDTFEAGIVLTGTEVKSLRSGQGQSSQDAYAAVEGGELWLINAYIPEYLQANRFNHEPRRPRSCCSTSARSTAWPARASATASPSCRSRSSSTTRGRAKVEIALARGKKLHDKRETDRQRSWAREKSRLLRDRG